MIIEITAPTRGNKVIKYPRLVKIRQTGLILLIFKNPKVKGYYSGIVISGKNIGTHYSNLKVDQKHCEILPVGTKLILTQE